MGKGRRPATAAARVEVEEEAPSEITRGGHGRGRGRAGPSISKTKKWRSMDELIGVDELQIQPKGTSRELEVGDEAIQAFPLSSSPSLICGVGRTKEVEEGGIYSDVEEGEEEVSNGRVAGRKLSLLQSEQGRGEAVATQVVEVLFTPVRSAAAVLVKGGRGGAAERKQPEHLGGAPTDFDHVDEVFDVMPNRTGCILGTDLCTQGAQGCRREGPMTGSGLDREQQWGRLAGGGHGSRVVATGGVGEGTDPRKEAIDRTRQVFDEMPQRKLTPLGPWKVVETD